MGINCSAEYLENAMVTSLNGLKGVRRIRDDILIWGATEEEHDANLEALFERLEEKGLTLKSVL